MAHTETHGQLSYRDDIELRSLGPFSSGQSGEVQEGMTRIYDKSGWPIVEVWANQKVVEQIERLLNSTVTA